MEILEETMSTLLVRAPGVIEFPFNHNSNREVQNYASNVFIGKGNTCLTQHKVWFTISRLASARVMQLGEGDLKLLNEALQKMWITW